ncbi:MAG TPA: RebB family R body protein [Caulobacter sp.]|nr:RebB family R body protein [Caulobacter sp.]
MADLPREKKAKQEAAARAARRAAAERLAKEQRARELKDRERREKILKDEEEILEDEEEILELEDEILERELRAAHERAEHRRRQRQKKKPEFDNFEEYLRLTMELCRDPATAPMATAVADAMLSTIAVGPSFAAMQSMVAANQANGIMYYNAVANQQMGNIIGMVATMNCVQVLLDKDGLVPFPEFPVAGGGA